MGSVPSFFYIGAPRAGSTWLYKNLQRHPVVWVPPCKNISYFHPRFQVYRYQRFQKFGKELLTNGDPADQTLVSALLPAANRERPLVCQPVSARAGSPARSPNSYCSLERPQIAHLHDMAPSAKIIFVLRDPIDRVLSQAKWGLPCADRGRFRTCPMRSSWPTSTARARTCARVTRGRWISGVNSSRRIRFLVLFYEDLMAQSWRVPQQDMQLSWRRVRGPFPQRDDRGQECRRPPIARFRHPVVKHAALACREEIDRLADRFGGPALGWQHRMEELVE